MAVRLPEDYVNRMKLLLGGEAEPFLASYAKPRAYGLRVNTLKVDVERFLALSPFTLEPVPWAEAGFYYGSGDRPGKHPHYHAGLYYIQEPSAMAPAELLQVEPGDRVLDLCAAPGGKSTQIAAKLRGRGLLVANDIQRDRVKALVKNLALFGVKSAVVTNEAPEALVRPFRRYFDKIIIDAPCSGEGMFRKEEEMKAGWHAHYVHSCSLLQRDMLEKAALMLAPGGRIAYSTCTFAPEENEATVARFLEGHPEFSVEPVRAVNGFASGRPDWISGAMWQGEEVFSPAAASAVAGTVRLWPHRLGGEGHFVAVLRHSGASRRENWKVTPASGHISSGSEKLMRGGGTFGNDGTPGSADLSSWFAFMEANLTEPIEGRWLIYGNAVYRTSRELPDLSGIRVARPGWFVGTLRKNRFEPSQALAMGLTMEQALRRIDFRSDSGEIIRYLKGETVQIGEDRIDRAAPDVSLKGYCLIGVDGFPVGWGKWLNGMLKNEYPPGWRWT